MSPPEPSSSSSYNMLPEALQQAKSRLKMTYLFTVALEGLEIERVNRVGQISHPLDGLPTGDKPDIIKG